MATESAQTAKGPRPLDIYLNDHLAGSSAAIELLDHLQRVHAGTPISQFAADLKKDIFEDRQQLQLLMLQLNIPESRIRQAGTWMIDQLVRWKTELESPGDGSLRLFAMLEMIAVGIDGKIALWAALAETAKGTPELGKLNYELLKQRACEQRRRVEEKRLSAAIDALRLPPPPIAPHPASTY